MERIFSINPDRIAWCCADFGIALNQLAAEAAIPLQTLERFVAREDGGGLTFKQLSQIAACFCRDVLFFLEPGPDEVEHVHTRPFRTLPRHKPALSARLKLFIERVERQRRVFMALRDELENADLPRFEHPFFPVNDIAELASATRKWLGLGTLNTFDTYRAAIERKGILVFRSDGHSGQWQIASESPILGFTLYDEECPLIVVKTQRSESQQSFTLVHELAHMLLQQASAIDDETDMRAQQGIEGDANALAGQVLVPDQYLRQIRNRQRPNDVSKYDAWLQPQARTWGISGDVILRRLRDAGRLPQAQYAAYHAWRNGLPIAEAGRATSTSHHREPLHIFGEPFVRTVLDALDERKITLSKASSYLDGLTLNDLHALEHDSCRRLRTRTSHARGR